MKKIYFLALLSIGALAGKAQYTITASSNPVIGDVETTYDADTAGVATGAVGTGITWNYTGIVISPTAAVNSNSYVAKTSAPNYTAFPSATIAQEDQSGTYSMWDYSSSAATLYGSSDGATTVVYSNPEIIYTIPFTYGSVSNDTYAGTFSISGYPVSTSGTVTTTGVGAGTLNMPGGKSYTNVLKVKAATHAVTNISSLGYSSTDDAVSYVYISSVSKNAILSITTSTSVVTTTSTATSYDKSVSVNKPLQTTGIIESRKDANFSLYPNPANNSEVSLYFVLANDESYEMSIYNTMGQVVQTRSFSNLHPGIYNETINLGGLDRGIYYIRLKGSKTEGMQKLVIQ